MNATTSNKLLLSLAAALLFAATGCATLAQRLGSQDAKLRAEAAQQINDGHHGKVQLKPEEHAPVIAALEGGEPATQQAATILVRENGDAALLPPVVALLGVENDSLRGYAVAAITSFPPADQIAALTPALDAAEVVARITALEKIAELKDPSTLASLIGKLGDADATVRTAAIGALAGFEATVLRTALVDGRAQVEAVLADGEASIRLAAIQLVADSGEKSFVSALVLRLGDEDSAVQEAATSAAAALGEAELMPAAVEACDDKTPSVRLGAVNLLGKMRNTEAAGALAERVSDPDETVRRTAIEALAGFDNELLAEQAPTLQRTLPEALKIDAPVIGTQLIGLARATGDTGVLLTLVPLFGMADEALRNAALDAVAASGPACKDAMVKTLAHSDPTVRAGAIAVLGRLGDKSVLDPLAVRLTRDPKNTEQLLDALQKIDASWHQAKQVPAWTRNIIKLCTEYPTVREATEKNNFAAGQLKHLAFQAGQGPPPPPFMPGADGAPSAAEQREGQQLLMQRKQTVNRIARVVGSLSIAAWREVGNAVIKRACDFGEGRDLEKERALFKGLR